MEPEWQQGQLVAGSHGRSLLAVVCFRVHAWQFLVRRCGGGAGGGELWGSAAAAAVQRSVTVAAVQRSVTVAAAAAALTLVTAAVAAAASVAAAAVAAAFALLPPGKRRPFGGRSGCNRPVRRWRQLLRPQWLLGLPTN